MSFFPHYFNFDMNFPSEYHYSFGTFFDLVQWQFDWTNIKYTHAELDIADTIVSLEEHVDKHVVRFKFPAIKHWEITAHQHVNNVILPDQSNIQLIFKDFRFDFKAGLKLDEHGYLDPVVTYCDIAFGESYFYHDDQFIAFIMHQFIYFGIVIIENSTYFVGETIFTHMLGPVMDDFLNHYEYKFSFPSLVRGQNTFDEFALDFRNVRDPTITAGEVDFFFFGDLKYNGVGCDLNVDQELSMKSNPHKELSNSQVVISEAAATCIANQVASSRIGKIHMNKNLFNDFWGTGDKLDFSTTSFSSHMPMF